MARLGGDEFAIILVNLESETTVNTLATRIIERLSQPVTVDGCLVKSGTSIGISLYPYDAADPDELIMYRTRFLGHKFVSCGGPE